MHCDGPVGVWIILALLPVIIPGILAVIVSRFLGRSGCVSMLMMLALGIALIFGVTSYLDSLGVTVKGQIVSKKESIVYHEDGSWDHALIAVISYKPTETASPEIAELNVLPSRFDDLNRGDFVMLRIPSKDAELKITRLEEQGTFGQAYHWLSHQPFLLFFALGSIALLAIRLRFQASLPQIFFCTGIVVVASWWLASVGGPIWESSTTLLGSMNSASATIREVHPLSSGEGVSGWFSETFFSSSQLVLLDVVQPGRFDPMLTVDEIDAGSVPLRPGQVLNIEYSTGDPRVAYLSDASRSFVWKNALIGSFLALVLLVGITWVAYQFGALPTRASTKRRPRTDLEE